jgi:ATP citrate (pro-S)-lyase
LRENFPATPLLDYALEVEKITTSKKPNLILNVDGIIGVAFVDLLRNSGCFTRFVAIFFFYLYNFRLTLMKILLLDLFREEAQEYIEIGTINGLFVLGRCTGFIGK